MMSINQRISAIILKNHTAQILYAGKLCLCQACTIFESTHAYGCDVFWYSD